MDFGKILEDGILGFAHACWALIRDSFSAGAMTPEWWVTVVGGEVVTRIDGSVASTIDHPGMLNVVVVAMLPLLLIFVTIQVILSVFRGSTAGLVRALGMAVFAVPSVYVLTGIIWVVLGAVDQLSMWILTIGTDGGQADALGALLGLFGFAYDADTNDVLMDENYEQWAWAMESGAPGRFIMPFVIAIVIWVACLILMLMMMFRLVAVIVLTVFGPVAVFSLALEPAKAIGSRWLSMLVALIVAKPAAAVIVKIGLVASSIGSSWVQLASGLILVLLAAAMPVLMITMVSFMTGGASEAMERGAMAGGARIASAGQRGVGGAARRAGRMGSNVARSASRAINPARSTRAGR